MNGGIIPLSSNVKYLGLHLDAGLRWTEHIKFLRSRSAKYINILKWLVGKGWSISLFQAISFANTTIITQLLWSLLVYQCVKHFRVLDSIATSAYKIALSLPISASNKTCWAISAQSTIKHRITIACDKYILKSVQFKKSIIVNKYQSILEGLIRAMPQLTERNQLM